MAVPNPPSVRGSVLLNQADFPNYVARSPTGVWVVDSAGCTRYANDALARMLGYSAIEMIGRPFFDFMDHEERKLAEHYLQRRMAGVAETHQFQFRRRDDGILSALISGSQIEVGSELMYLAHVVDLGHVMQHRRDHAIIEQNFERLIMHSPYAIAMTTLDGAIMQCNLPFRTLVGLSPEEVRLHSLDALFQWPLAQPHWSKAINGTEPGNYVTTLHRSDGGNRQLRTVVLPTVDEQGIRGALHCFVDITDGLVSHNRVVAEREDLERQVREKTQDIQLRALAMDATMEGMAILRGETYVYMNAAHAQMYGWEPKDLIGLTWRELYTPAVQRWIEAVAMRELAVHGKWNGEVVGAKKDGTTTDIALSLVTVGDGVLVCCCRDIRDAKAREHQLRALVEQVDRANVELRNASRVKDLFLACMSHELRTPLHSILGCSEILAEDTFGPLSAQQRRYLEQLTASGHHLLSLINDVLDVSKLAAGQLELHRQHLWIQDAVATSVGMVSESAHQKGVALTVSLGVPTDMSIWADERRIVQVLVNLLSNAVKFTPAGGHVQVRGSVERSYVHIDIVDTGIGISEEAMVRLFEPFGQLDSSLTRKYEGSGLGLFLARRLAMQHGGDILVESRAAHGSTFTLRLPVVDGSGHSIESKESTS